MRIRLSRRMEALAALVTTGHRLADVGTDHGYIPIFLVLNGRIPSAVAMDINEGPLLRARENISACCLPEGKIEIRLSDGLERLRPGEADTVLIAGMGGYQVRRILTKGQTVLASVREVVLQPQSEIPQVRGFLRENGFVIADEDMVEEDGKFYPMMKARRGAADPFCVGRERLCDEFGPVLLQKRHPVLQRWMERENALLTEIAARLEEQEENEKIRARMLEIKNKRRLLAEAALLMTGIASEWR